MSIDSPVPVSVCEKCGKPQSKSGSMTEWIFDPTKCACAALSAENNAKLELSLCPLCGLPTKKRSEGSMTQWIFRSKHCSCMVSTEAESTVEEPNLPSDEMIAGSPYHFLGVAGRGGIGTVYKAMSAKLGKLVAVKVLQHQDGDPRAAQTFMREAKSASKVQHPNVLAILDFGEMQDGSLYMVAEWLDGITLAQYLTRHGRPSLDTTVEIACQVLDGLSHAHKNNVVHRDIKPSNIMLGRTASGGWTVKIIDFGTAKEIGQEGALTRAENIACSPYYMSPEQATGLLIEQTSDLYSLGCTLFEALTGKPPFTGHAMNVVMRHQTEPPPSLSVAAGGAEFPAYLEQIMAKLLEKSPCDRFQTAAEVKAALVDQLEVSSEGSSTAKTLSPKMVTLVCLLAVFSVIAVTAPIVFTLLQVTPSKVKLGPDRDMSAVMPSMPGVDELAPGDGIAKYREHDRTGLHHIKFSQIPKFDMKRLRDLDFRYSGFTDKNMNLVENALKLHHLDLTETELTDEGLDKLPQLTDLLSLRLKNTKVTDKGVKELVSKVPSLLSIDLCDTTIGDAGVEALAGLKNLRTVNLAFTKATDKGVEALVTSCPELSTLNLTALKISDRCLESIANHSSKMDNLSIAQCDITDAGLSKLKTLTNIRRLFLTDNGRISQRVIDDLHRRLPQSSIVISGHKSLVSRINKENFRDDGVGLAVHFDNNRKVKKDGKDEGAFFPEAPPPSP